MRNVELCEYLDRECPADKRRRIDAELAASAQLAERIALWRRNDSALRLALAPEPPTGRRHPVQELLRRAAEHDAPAIRSVKTAPPPSAYGGLAMIAFGGGCFSAILALSVLMLGSP